MSITLRTYVAIIFATFIILFTSIISWSITNKTTEQVKSEIGDSLASVAYVMADKLDHFMWARYGEVQVLSTLNAFKEFDDAEETQNLINELQRNFPSFSWIGFTDENGIVQVSTGNILEGVDISSRPVFTESQKETFIGDVHDAVLLSSLLPNPSGEPLQFVDISTPIFNDDDEFKGVLATHLSWEWSKEAQAVVVSSLKEQYKNQLDILIISSFDNTVLLGPEELVGQSLELDSIEQSRLGENEWAVELWPDGKKYVTGYAYGAGYAEYPGLGWTVLVRQPESIAFEAVKELRHSILWSGVVGALVFAFLGWILAGRISKSLRQLSKYADELRTGKRKDIPVQKGINEIEVLSTSLRELVQSLTKTEGKLGEMQNLALHDKLTGLPNRVALDRYLSWFKEEHSEDTLSFFYLDLDGFKQVNDTYGHHTGDVLLQEVAARLKEVTANHDIVVRLGGDEFVLCMQNVGQVHEVASVIIQSLNKPFFLVENTEPIHIGCSIGIALWNAKEKDEDPLKVINRADQALYQSKQNGKNQYTVHST
ncbi:sensor domain-containing diguanylate cyclase [Bacillus sp. FJAT-45066]|uniref:sensor domain-containing diguanylate cyclase n=1 Tax=Bacillus sp. FJAT-45066 TaxID=2011010 RepID=UPI000BB98BB0|nr:diguanylate cyclase [Bacillus sp. FJAT-45066]